MQNNLFLPDEDAVHESSIALLVAINSSRSFKMNVIKFSYLLSKCVCKKTHESYHM